MTDSSAADRYTGSAAELLPRLRLIEDQPLDQRAAAYAQLHDRLQADLDAADASRSRG